MILIDFEDSFTHNIAACLAPADVHIVHYRTFLSDKNFYLTSFKRFILGPGPGHPDDYSDMFPAILQLTGIPSLFTLGVCLGHQLLWRAQGAKISPRPRPSHGEARNFVIPHWSIFPSRLKGHSCKVQLYNSLMVSAVPKGSASKLAWQQGALMASWGTNFLSYQFHPESVGTSFPKVFFRPFLYNQGNEAKHPLRGHLRRPNPQVYAG